MSSNTIRAQAMSILEKYMRDPKYYSCIYYDTAYGAVGTPYEYRPVATDDGVLCCMVLRNGGCCKRDTPLYPTEYQGPSLQSIIKSLKQSLH